MKVLVTGGAGFIGGNLCAALEQDPSCDVIAFDDLSTGSIDNLRGVSRTQLVQGTILDGDLLVRLMEGVDAVVHLAARPSVSRSIEDPSATHETNATGTLRVLEAARRRDVSHVVVASSSSVYGNSATLPKHECMPTAPRSPYAASKLATESYALAHAAAFDLGVLAFRFFNVFGPLQPAGHAYAAVIPAFISAAIRGEPLPIFGDGNQTRDFTYVGSVAGIIRDALHRRVTSPVPVNLAFGSRSSLVDLAHLLEKVLEQPLRVERHPPRAGDIQHSQADNSRLLQLFPGARPVELEAGLRLTVDWFRSQSPG